MSFYSASIIVLAKVSDLQHVDFQSRIITTVLVRASHAYILLPYLHLLSNGTAAYMNPFVIQESTLQSFSC